MSSTTILIVDDHVLFRESLSQALGELTRFTILSCGTAAEAIEILSRSAIDIVLLDYDLGSESALNIVYSEPPRWFQACPILILTAGVSLSTARQLLSCNRVAGLLEKDVSLSQLRDNLLSLATDGRKIIDSRYAAAVTAVASDCELSGRERQVLQLLVEGLSNKEIAVHLFTSESTVKNVLQALFRAFNVRTRSQLVRVALEQKVFLGKARNECFDVRRYH